MHCVLIERERDDKLNVIKHQHLGTLDEEYMRVLCAVLFSNLKLFQNLKIPKGKKNKYRLWHQIKAVVMVILFIISGWLNSRRKVPT